MSALGWGLAFENVQKALAQMIAQRQLDSRDAKEDQFRRDQMAEQQRQFNVSEEGQNTRFTKQMDFAAAQERGRQNQFGLEQMERDRVTLAREALMKDPKWAPYAGLINAGMQPTQTPEDQQKAEMAKLAAQQKFEAEQNALQRRNALSVASMYGPRRPDPKEQFLDDFRNLQTRLALQPDVADADKMKALRDFVQFGSLGGAYTLDPKATEAFITPGVDPFVKSRFGGNYDEAVRKLEMDPFIYAQLVQSGLDPDRILSAVQQAQAQSKAQQQQQRLQQAQQLLRQQISRGRMQ